jgi:ClpX C4-type zinc finger protein
MDEELLAEARRAEERLIDAERDAEVFRAEFHRAVRRLHLSGASLRDLAGALGLSHQRVHQIVESAGGSRRWLRQREPGQQEPGDRALNRPGLQLACTFCGQNQAQVQKLIAGPHAFICDACVGHARSMINSSKAADATFARVVLMPEREQPGRGQQVKLACSFCGKQRHQVAGMAASSAPPGPSPSKRGLLPRAAVCTECLDLCDEIIAEDLSENTPPENTPPEDPT